MKFSAFTSFFLFATASLVAAQSRADVDELLSRDDLEASLFTRDDFDDDALFARAHFDDSLHARDELEFTLYAREGIRAAIKQTAQNKVAGVKQIVPNARAKGAGLLTKAAGKLNGQGAPADGQGDGMAQ